MRAILILLLISSTTYFAHAQKSPICGSDQVNKRLIEQDPSFKQKRDAFELQWQAYNNSRGKKTIINSDTSYEIPIVIHVIHTGGALGTNYNPADTQLVNWVAYVNQVFAAQYASYPDTSNGGTYFPIRFVLAQRDSNCNLTTGIVRVDGSVLSGYSTYGLKYSGSNGATEAALRGLSHWPEQTYYNIYVVNKIDSIDPYLPFPGSSYVAGFAYFPGAGSSDAAFMLAHTAHQGNSTMPHEMGHAMGLAHTFEGGDTATCPANNNCTTDGDKVCDTEPVKNLLFVYPCLTNSDINSCTGTNYNSTQKNIMGYGSCLDRFTPGQRDRAILQLLSMRAGLASSVATLPPGVPVTAANCTPTIVNSTNTFGMGPCDVTLNTMSYTSGGYNIDNNQVYLDHSCVLQTVLAPSTSYTLSVTTKVNAQKVRAYIDFNNNGVFASTELVLDHVGTLANETHTASFTAPTGAVQDTPLRMRVVADWAGSTTPTSCSALDYGQAEDFGVFVSTGNPLPVKLLNFYADVMKKEKQIRINWQTVSEIMLGHFSLERSTDGEQYIEIGKQTAAGKAASYWFIDKDVVPDKTYYYRLRSVDLDGKYTYSKTITAKLSEDQQVHIQVFPNPVSGNELTYEMDMPITTADILILDISGKVLLKKTIKESKGVFDISKLPQGNYVMQVQSATGVLATQKVLVQR